MPTSPEALEQFLTRTPEPTFTVRGKGEAWLRDVIHRTTGLEWRPKVQWRGDDRDIRQLEAIAFALVAKQALIYYSPRTGKTRITLDWLQHLVRVGWIQRALITPHSPLGVDEWERQVPIFCDLDFAVIRSGDRAADQFAAALEAPNHGIIITGSTLQALFSEKRQITRGARKGQMRLYADVEALRLVVGLFQAIAVDEIHQINDPGSLRFDMLSELAPEDLSLCGWRLGLTGTPFGRNPFGLWSQARLVDGGQTLSRSFHFFQEAFGKRIYNHFTRTKDELVFDAKHMPALRAKLDHMALTCKLEDIQDVNIIAQAVELKMLREQERAYRELIDEMIEEQAGETEGQRTNRTRNIFVRLRQVASGYRVFNDLEGQERVLDFPSAKLAWLEEFAQSVDPEMKVVIFHEFVRSGAKVCQLLDKLKIKYTWLWGGSPDKRDAKDQFQYGDSPFLVANHATGGTGVDLSAAHYLCVYESPVGAIQREQMQMRPMARGSTPLMLDDLICAPVERRILGFHAEGKNLQDMFSKPRALAALLR